MSSSLSTHNWETRRVDALMQISYLGHHWSVLQVPDAQVGDLMQVASGVSGGVLCRRLGSAQQTCTLASPVGPAHSLLRTCQLQCNAMNLGNATTCCEKSRECLRPEMRAECKPLLPPSSIRGERTHNRTCGTEHEAPAAASTANSLEELHQCSGEQPCRMTGSDKGWVPSSSSVGCVVDAARLCQQAHFQSEVILETASGEGFQ